jgi:MYXO-CTERM domain-containing protein
VTVPADRLAAPSASVRARGGHSRPRAALRALLHRADRLLPAITLFVALVTPASLAAAQVTYIDDPLTASPTGGAVAGVTAGSSGGSFGPEGWTTTGDTDTVWWVIPATIPRGRLEVSATGLSIATSLRGQEHDLFGIYGPVLREEPVPYNPWFRNNEFKILVRIFGDLNRCDGCQAVGASKLELALCPALTAEGYTETACPAACVAAGYDFWQAYLGPAGRGEELPWDAATEYRFVITWEPGLMTYSRGGPEGSSSLTYPGTYAPSELRVRIGPPSSERGPDTAMPRGVTFRNVRFVGETGAATPSCDLPVTMPDAGVTAACVDPMITATSLSPVDGRGASQVFHAVYDHCAGAAAFRIAQLWVGASVEPAVPHVAASFEAGRFFLEGTDASCAPGEATVLTGTNGTLDCARSTATPAGEELTVDWALSFDVATLAGAQGVFFDAKGTAVPEPRLGWTRMGTFTVEAASMMDAGRETMDAGGDAGAARRPSVMGGCGCSAGAPSRGLPWVAVVGLAVLFRRRRAQRISRGRPCAAGGASIRRGRSPRA